MKKIIFSALGVFIMASGCSVFQGSQKYGCPTNGKNIGAEKIASGDPASVKAAHKAKKFRN